MKTSEAKFIRQSCLMLESASSLPEIQSQLARFTYDAAKLKEGRQLYQKAIDTKRRQKETGNQQLQATRILHEARLKARSLYRKHIATARLAFGKEPEAIQKLGLEGERKRTNTEWILQATDFYHAVPAYASILAKYNVPAKELTEAKKLIEHITTLEVLQKEAIGQAQMATRHKNAAVEALAIWMKKFIRVARTAFQEAPERLEVMGIAVSKQTV